MRTLDQLSCIVLATRKETILYFNIFLYFPFFIYGIINHLFLFFLFFFSFRTQLCQVFSEEEVAHILLPKTGVINSYVLEGLDGKITDFCSFYHLPSSVIGNPLHNKLNAVYSYYNIANTISHEDLMKDLLIFAREEGADVFNALDVMDNGSVFENLKFGAGDGWLQYYVYNWKCPTMEASSVGLVLL